MRDNGNNTEEEKEKKIINDDIFCMYLLRLLLCSVLAYLINWPYNVCFFYRDWILSDSICNRIHLVVFFPSHLPVSQSLTVMVWARLKRLSKPFDHVWWSHQIRIFQLGLRTQICWSKRRKQCAHTYTFIFLSVDPYMKKKWSIDRNSHWRCFDVEIATAIECNSCENTRVSSICRPPSQGSAIQILNNNFTIDGSIRSNKWSDFKAKGYTQRMKLLKILCFC